MMLSRRPVSSPGRVEKYPPPLMGFLRSKSNGGSRSRSRSKGRSRASPLFVRRNKSATAVTQEPSSPKVTCMGQVRVNRSKPKSKNPTRKRCEWIRKFAGKIKTMSFRSNWGFCYRRKSEKESPRSQLDFPATESAVEGENFEIPKLVVSPVTSTPPINAFLLTRSRSAPYGSSSLAYRFWEENNQREIESRNGTEQIVRSEISVEKINVVLESAESSERTELGFIRGPELTRSKSEPARIGEKKMVFASVLGRV